MSDPRILILAGGLGTRIRSLFPDVPKPLVPIHDRPFLAWQIELLIAQGFKRFVFCISYLGQQIIDYFGDGSQWGVTIEYSIESSPLGTAGAIRQASKFIDRTTIILNGDTYFQTDYRLLIARHQQLVRESQSIASIVLVARTDTDRYGRVIIDNRGKIIEFKEKNSSLGAGLVNAGAYLIEPQLLDYIPPHVVVSLEIDILPQTIDRHDGVFGIPIDGTFIDMGSPDGYAELSATLEV
jgi:NDP-sugar pyrophosphorylase family protein